jgi:hypothetical protein
MVYVTLAQQFLVDTCKKYVAKAILRGGQALVCTDAARLGSFVGTSLQSENSAVNSIQETGFREKH